LIIDLHDLHTVPRGVLEQLLAADKRVCRFLLPASGTPRPALRRREYAYRFAGAVRAEPES
jgi:hypothetical protein